MQPKGPTPTELCAPNAPRDPSSAGRQDLYVGRPNGATVEQHAFLNAPGVTVGPGARVNIAGEDLPEVFTNAVKQPALPKQPTTAASSTSMLPFAGPLFREALAKKASLVEQPAPAESSDPIKQHTQNGQSNHLTAGRQDLYADRPNSVGFEQYAFVKATNATIDGGFCFNMDGEKLPQGATKQVAFQDASGMRLVGGFVGMGSSSVAQQFVENQQLIKRDHDSQLLQLKREEIALRRRDIELREQHMQRRSKCLHSSCFSVELIATFPGK